MSIYVIGMVATFVFAYPQARKGLSHMRSEDPVDNYTTEFMSILVGILGAMAWPLTWLVYLIHLFTKKKKGVEEVQELPSGYTFKVTHKGMSFESVTVYNENGYEVASAFTKIYGLEGAAKEAEKEALKILKIENRGASEYEELNIKYNRKSVQ